VQGSKCYNCGEVVSGFSSYRLKGRGGTRAGLGAGVAEGASIGVGAVECTHHGRVELCARPSYAFRDCEDARAPSSVSLWGASRGPRIVVRWTSWVPPLLTLVSRGMERRCRGVRSGSLRVFSFPFSDSCARDADVTAHAWELTDVASSSFGMRSADRRVRGCRSEGVRTTLSCARLRRPRYGVRVVVRRTCGGRRAGCYLGRRWCLVGWDGMGHTGRYSCGIRHAFSVSCVWDVSVACGRVGRAHGGYAAGGVCEDVVLNVCVSCHSIERRWRGVYASAVGTVRYAFPAFLCCCSLFPVLAMWTFRWRVWAGGAPWCRCKGTRHAVCRCVA
jgi:hypothetical protein